MREELATLQIAASAARRYRRLVAKIRREMHAAVQRCTLSRTDEGRRGGGAEGRGPEMLQRGKGLLPAVGVSRFRPPKTHFIWQRAAGHATLISLPAGLVKRLHTSDASNLRKARRKITLRRVRVKTRAWRAQGGGLLRGQLSEPCRVQRRGYLSTSKFASASIWSMPVERVKGTCYNCTLYHVLHPPKGATQYNERASDFLK